MPDYTLLYNQRLEAQEGVELTKESVKSSLTTKMKAEGRKGTGEETTTVSVFSRRRATGEKGY